MNRGGSTGTPAFCFNEPALSGFLLHNCCMTISRPDPCSAYTMEVQEVIGLERSEKTFRPWIPKRVLFTPDAVEEAYGQEIYNRIRQRNIPVEIGKNNAGRGECTTVAVEVAAHSAVGRLAVSLGAGLPGTLSLLLSRRLTFGTSRDTSIRQPAPDTGEPEKLSGPWQDGFV
jgi:hypothetical protein